MPPFDQAMHEFVSLALRTGTLAELRHSLAAPTLMLVILLTNWVYHLLKRTSDGQQKIEIGDMSNLNTASCAALREQLTLIQARNIEFQAQTRKARAFALALPEQFFRASRGEFLRCADRHVVKDRSVVSPLICADDLVTEGNSHFFEPVKVGGDLVVKGNATFFEVVVVNGVLKVEGDAHFAVGVVAKGDTFVSGTMTIGSEDNQGWAALRRFAMGDLLRLNGSVVASSAVQLREAA